MTRHYPTGHSYRIVAGISNRFPMDKKLKRLPSDRVGRISAATDAALRGWWAQARTRQKLLHTNLEEGFDWHGGSNDWPDWVSVEALAQQASREIGTKVSRPMLGEWLGNEGIDKKSIAACRRNRRGRIVYRSHKIYYDMGSYRISNGGS